MKHTTVWILGDQLAPTISSLDGCDPATTTVLLVESMAHARRIPYHKQKLVLVWSAMQHFAAELRDAGWTVDYHTELADFAAGLDAHQRRHQPDRVRIMAGAEYGVTEKLAALWRDRGVTVEITPNTMFLSDPDDFRRWAAGRKQLTMEGFYRRMRRSSGLLMDDDQPAGGAWNFDKQNRERPPADHRFPDEPRFPPDSITREVMAAVERHFPDHFGTLAGFNLPVTRAGAEQALTIFLDERLDLFGPLQDAIVAGQPMMYHSQLSPLLNIGLLDPLAVCRAAEDRYRRGEARIQSVEGFIRQVLGWREFVYQVYHHEMPGYTDRNELEATLPLPSFYWDGDTDMACVSEAVTSLIDRGINHHIQRLMVTGVFALTAGIDPGEVNRWYWLAYTDAYEWVVSPNVIGMALFADGGVVATKPYAASGRYIDRMSNHCRGCRYNVRESVGEQACPFNALFWDFLARHRPHLAGNPRMGLMLRNLDRKDPGELAAIRERAAHLQARLRAGERI